MFTDSMKANFNGFGSSISFFQLFLLRKLSQINIFIYMTKKTRKGTRMGKNIVISKYCVFFISKEIILQGSIVKRTV